MALLGPNELTLNMLNCFKDYIGYIHIVSYLGLGLSQVDKINSGISTCCDCCLPNIANTMPADGLEALGASASAGIVLTPKAGIFHLQHQKSWYSSHTKCYSFEPLSCWNYFRKHADMFVFPKIFQHLGNTGWNPSIYSSNVMDISLLELEWEQAEISIKLELWWRNRE